MPFRAHRRFIVALALLCQVMTAALVHVPMSYARVTTDVAVSEVADCPDHGHMSQATPTDSAAGASNSSFADSLHPPGGHDSGGCHSGGCKCTCAHTPGTSSAMTLTPSAAPPSRVEIFYRVPLAPECATTLFRPPI